MELSAVEFDSLDGIQSREAYSQRMAGIERYGGEDTSRRYGRKYGNQNRKAAEQNVAEEAR